MTRASSARLASRSPSAEPSQAHDQAASQPVPSSATAKRRAAPRASRAVTANGANGDSRSATPAASTASTMTNGRGAARANGTPTLAGPAAGASGRASRMLSLSQLDSATPGRRSTRHSMAAAAAASQPVGGSSQGNFLARDEDEDEDDEDESDSDDDAAGGKKGKGRTAAKASRQSMSQPVTGRNGGRPKNRKSELWN